MRRTLVLAILDGWGIGRKDVGNPIHTQQTPYLSYIRGHYRIGSLQASGIAVGLPWGEEGNSEVGHLTIGAGKTIYQHYPRITMAIRSGEFFANPTLKAAFAHAKKRDSSVHFVGLLTEGNVHSSLEHLTALFTMAEREGVDRIALHLFADGEDGTPKSLLPLLQKLGHADRVASVSGRYYAMDRDEHWDRTQRAYAALVGQAPVAQDIETQVHAAYEKQPNDRFIEPFLVNPEKAIRDGDAVIFFDFREDRMRQIVRPFVDPEFKEFPAMKFSDLSVCTFTRYADAFNLPVAFEPERVTTTLGSVLADAGKTQLRIAESEKYPHITYFFNGYREEPYPNEYRALVPSYNTPHPEEHPEMRAKEIADRAIQAIEERSFDFVLLNFANPDIIAHTGDINAARTAVEVIDGQIGRLGKAVSENNAILIITSDHGNIERVLEPETGMPQTRHDPSPVPVYLIAQEYYTEKSLIEADATEAQPVGILSDVAPTILALLGIPKPPEMTGENLLTILS